MSLRNEYFNNNHLVKLSENKLLNGSKSKGKAILLEVWTGPEGSRSLRLTDFKTVGTGWW